MLRIIELKKKLERLKPLHFINNIEIIKLLQNKKEKEKKYEELGAFQRWNNEGKFSEWVILESDINCSNDGFRGSFFSYNNDSDCEGTAIIKIGEEWLVEKLYLNDYKKAKEEYDKKVKEIKNKIKNLTKEYTILDLSEAAIKTKMLNTVFYKNKKNTTSKRVKDKKQYKI